MFRKFVLALVLLAAGCGVAQAQGLMGGLLGPGKASPASSPAGATAVPAESPAAIYARLCAPGDSTLSATTCQAMKRDIDSAAKPESEAAKAYRELCAPNGPKLSRETCAAMKVDAAKPPSKGPAASTTVAIPRNSGTGRPPQGAVVMLTTGDVAAGRRLSLMSGAKGVTHSFEAAKMKPYRVTLASSDDVMLRAFLGPASNKTGVLAFADSRSVRSMHLKMAEATTLNFFVTGVKGRGRYTLTVEELPEGPDTDAYLMRRQAQFAAMSGKLFYDAAKGVAFEDLSTATKSYIRRLSQDGGMVRAFEYPVGNPRGLSWVHDNQSELEKRYDEPASMHLTFDSITLMTAALGAYDLIYVLGVDDSTGDLLATVQGDYRPFDVYRLKPLTASEAQLFRRQFAAAAEQRRANTALAAQNRSEMWGNVLQGALIAGQAYASGMQEANQANARSQAIIDAAAESDRQYRAAQAAELAQRAGTQPPTRPQLAAAKPAWVAPPPKAPAASKPSAVPGTGSNPPVHLYCYRWIEALTGERTSYVSQVGAVPKTALNPEIESRMVARWSDYLDTQGIGTSGVVGCRLDTDRTYNAQNRSAFIGTARSRPKDTLQELAWAPS
ncbi:hypothetical protein [Caulobacter henricii]|uniref:Lysozyme inhibitor LprI N-terminal domain-containing protein n=1 Tax=Caulobacter henricii TaxID=69395 RepID=A0A0P0P2K1_9CAUL|nr:hypothetical protein [Caulobacter henricii]ALL14549.1 hypothetical protein AQ619_14995 [Caulobacter henricii]